MIPKKREWCEGAEVLRGPTHALKQHQCGPENHFLQPCRLSGYAPSPRPLSPPGPWKKPLASPPCQKACISNSQIVGAVQQCPRMFSTHMNSEAGELGKKRARKSGFIQQQVSKTKIKSGKVNLLLQRIQTILTENLSLGVSTRVGVLRNTCNFSSRNSQEPFVVSKDVCTRVHKLP